MIGLYIRDLPKVILRFPARACAPGTDRINKYILERADCTVLKSHFERIGHLYDIKFWGLKSRSNCLSSIALPCTNFITSKLYSLLVFENSHWPFYFDWLFKIWTDSGFIQNLIRGLRYYQYTVWLKWIATLCSRYASPPPL